MGNNFDPVSLHKYLYANSDPVRYTDPSGNMGLISLGAASNIRARFTAMATPTFARTFSRALWGDVKDFAKDQLTEQAFGLIGQHVVQHMIGAVSGVANVGQSAQSFGSTSHKLLQDLIDESSDNLNEYLEKFNAEVKAELFRDKNSNPTKMRAKGSMGLDVVVMNTKTKKVIFSFDLKTGKTGTSKNKSKGYSQRFDGAPIIDVFVRRTK
jgi:hypothetical protein